MLHLRDGFTDVNCVVEKDLRNHIFRQVFFKAFEDHFRVVNDIDVVGSGLRDQYHIYAGDTIHLEDRPYILGIYLSDAYIPEFHDTVTFLRYDEVIELVHRLQSAQCPYGQLRVVSFDPP